MHGARRSALGIVALATVPAVALAVFFVLPVAGMVAQGLWPDGELDLMGALEVLGRSRTHRVLWFTLWSAAAATLVTLLLGLPLAFALYRLRLPGHRLLRAFVMMPFVLPTVVVGVAFRTLLVSDGPLGWLDLDGTPVAIVAAMVFFNLAVVVRTVGGLWENLDPRTGQAAAALGATPSQVFRTVTLPALRPAVVSAASVVFLFCATAFGIVLTLGGLRYATVESEIYLLTTQFLDLRAAAALSLLQLLVVTGLLVAAHVGRSSREHALQRTAAQSAARRPRSGDLPLLGVTVLALGLVAAPVLALVLGSLRVGDGWTLDHYRALGSTSEAALLVPVTEALANSWRTAVDATLIAMTLGVLVAVVVSRTGRSRGERRTLSVLDGLFMLPLGVSAVTLGFGMLITLDEPPLDLRDSALLVPVAQAMVALPLVVRTVAPVLRSIDPRQRQAAASLGASPLRVLATVDLPTVWRPLLAATGFAFAVSLGEFGATSFLSRADRPTLPVVIYQLIGNPGAASYGMALAASVLLGGLTVAVMASVERLRIGSIGAF
jgi:thiamine transport system permease protein